MRDHLDQAGVVPNITFSGESTPSSVMSAVKGLNDFSCNVLLLYDFALEKEDYYQTYAQSVNLPLMLRSSQVASVNSSVYKNAIVFLIGNDYLTPGHHPESGDGVKTCCCI